MYVYMNQYTIYIYIYGDRPKNYRPFFFIANTVSNQLFRKVRTLNVTKLPKSNSDFKGACQPPRLCSSTFSFDLSTRSTVLFQLKTNFPFPRENQLKQTKNLQPNSQKMFLGFLLRKDGFGVKNRLFPRKKMVLGRKTNFFQGKTQKNIL